MSFLGVNKLVTSFPHFFMISLNIWHLVLINLNTRGIYYDSNFLIKQTMLEITKAEAQAND